VELRVPVTELSRPIAPEKFRSKTEAVGGFVFGLLIFPRGTKSAPEHAKKNRNPEKGEKGKGAVEKEPEPEVKDTRWISAFVEARPTEDYPGHWYFQDVQFLVSLVNHSNISNSIVKHDKHTFSPTESSDGKAIDRGWHDFVSCDEHTLRSGGFVDPRDDTVCFRASVYLAGGPMRVTNIKSKQRYAEMQKFQDPSCGSLSTFVNSLVQIWFHMGQFRNLVYNAEPTMLEEVQKLKNAIAANSGQGGACSSTSSAAGKEKAKRKNTNANTTALEALAAAAASNSQNNLAVPQQGGTGGGGGQQKQFVTACLREVFGRLQGRSASASAAKLTQAYPCSPSTKKDCASFMTGLYGHILSELETGTSSTTLRPSFGLTKFRTLRTSQSACFTDR
jgi:hypothetical protein